MNKLIFIIPFCLLISACVSRPYSVYTETMLPDGRTWEVKSHAPCDDISDKIDPQLGRKEATKALAAACSDRLLKGITKYGTELCGAPPARVFSCGFKGDEDQRGYGSCYVKCPLEK